MTDLLNRILKRLEELQFYDSGTVSVEQTTRGTRFHAAPQRKSGTPGGLNLRGEYDPTATYALNDMVVISTGLNQGTFVAIANGIAAGTAPYTGGGNWTQLPGGLLGNWF